MRHAVFVMVTVGDGRLLTLVILIPCSSRRALAQQSGLLVDLVRDPCVQSPDVHMVTLYDDLVIAMAGTETCGLSIRMPSRGITLSFG